MILAAWSLIGPAILGAALTPAPDPTLSLSSNAVARVAEPQSAAQSRRALQEGTTLATLNGFWVAADRFVFLHGGEAYEVQWPSGDRREIEELPSRPAAAQSTHPNAQRRNPARARQFTEAFSADGRWRSHYQDGNIYVTDREAERTWALTEDGQSDGGIRFGTGCWVYGEELGQREAMGWRGDGDWLWFFEVDETGIQLYHLAHDQTEIQTRLQAEAYPKAGTPNPRMDIWVWNSETEERHQVPVREGEFDHGMGHLVFAPRWSSVTGELIFHRMDRLQKHLEVVAYDPDTRESRVLWEDSRPQSWVEPNPTWREFDWQGETYALVVRDGNDTRTLHRLHLASGEAIALYEGPGDVLRLVEVMPDSDTVFFMVGRGLTPYMHQLVRADLGGDAVRPLTAFDQHHRVDVSPGGEAFIALSQTVEEAPVLRLHDARTGRAVATLAESRTEGFAASGFRPTERIEFRAADGVTRLYGTLDVPANWDGETRLPLIVNVYAGPGSQGFNENFSLPGQWTDLGFAVASFNARGNAGRGKRFVESIYGRLGTYEVDDQAAGVRYLVERGVVDPERVGIIGTSYGGYAVIMALLRHPDVFQAGVAASSVTDWRNYDTIYTERYMGLPQENEEGYRIGNAMTWAENLQGRLMIFWGTSDDNVHPSNSLQLIAELTRLGKDFEVMVAPDRGHVGMPFAQSSRFFRRVLLGE